MVSDYRQNKSALLLAGGWEGHQPEVCADFAANHLLQGFDVVRSQSLDVLQADTLAEFDLLIPVWTFGELKPAQETALLEAVQDGLGIASWHGFASAFLASRPHKHLLGGQFVAHPGGETTTYNIHFAENDQLVDGLADFRLTSEQYYMLVDPAVKVLATTNMVADDSPWLAGVEMPVVWKRLWGSGRVFYCSLGHSIDVLGHPTVTELLQRGAHWAARSVTSPLAVSRSR